MEKGYYQQAKIKDLELQVVAIHNKNGKGLLPASNDLPAPLLPTSQSTIKMEKGYYHPT